MTNHQYNERDPEREEVRPDTPDQVDQELRAAGNSDRTSGRASGRRNMRETGDTTDTTASDATPKSPRSPRSPRKRDQKPRASEGGVDAKSPTGAGAGAGSIIRLPRRDEADILAEQEDDGNVAVHELEAQGFTVEEATRLIHVSDRVATSREAREAEATLRRLRFTRWLIERGMLDEFSA